MFVLGSTLRPLESSAGGLVIETNLLWQGRVIQLQNTVLQAQGSECVCLCVCVQSKCLSPYFMTQDIFLYCTTTQNTFKSTGVVSFLQWLILKYDWTTEPTSCFCFMSVCFHPCDSSLIIYLVIWGGSASVVRVLSFQQKGQRFDFRIHWITCQFPRAFNSEMFPEAGLGMYEEKLDVWQTACAHIMLKK